MSERRHVLPPGVLPRGLCRESAAQWVGLSTTKFDQLVKDGRMPKPKAVDGRRIWDSRALDRAFDALSDATDEAPNPWHAVP